MLLLYAPTFSPQRCGLPFFDVPCEQLACDLLGAVLCHETLEGVCKGRIVETEAYLGAEDKAAHSYQGRRTERNEAMYMPPGTVYVYFVYGVHCCANISSQGDGAAVLIRALEPVAGLEVMRGRRKQAKKTKDLCSGPAKLCQAMGIKLAENKINLCSSSTLWLEKDGYAITSDQIQQGPRVGVAYAGEKWAHAPLRFYIRGNQCVSKK